LCLPVFILEIALSYLVMSMGIDGDTSEGAVLEIFSSVANEFVLLILLSLVLSVSLTGAVMVAFKSFEDSQKILPYQALFIGFKKFFPLLWANLIHSLAYGIGFIMLVLPGFYLYSRLGLFSAYIMFEGKSAMDAISESWQDTETHQIKLFVLTSTFLGIQILFGLIGSFGEGSLNTSLLFLIAASLVKYMTLMPLFYLYFSLYQSLKK